MLNTVPRKWWLMPKSRLAGKKLIFTLLIFLPLSYQNIYSQSGWFWQNPLPQGNNLKAVKFADNNTAYACGEYGTVMKTTNRGINWSIIRIEPNRTCITLSFINANTGIVGYGASIYKTTNGGNSWFELFYFGAGIGTIEFTSADTVYATFNGSSNCTVKKSTNGGNNWFDVYTTPNWLIMKTCFINNITGYACGYSSASCIIAKTTNGGSNWIIQSQGNPGYLNSIKFLNANTGIAVGYFYTYPPYAYHHIIIITSNGGINWNRVSGTGGSTLYDISFSNNSIAFACGNNYFIKSTNYGNNWTSVSLPEGGGAFSSIDFKNSNGLMVGNYGIVLNSSNNGENWVNLFQSIRTPLSPVKCIRFSNKTTGYAILYNNLLKTMDGGNNWIIINTPASYNLNSISVINSDILYAAGPYSYTGYTLIIKSTNGGLNWISQNHPSSNGAASTSFINSSTGYCISYYDVSKTTNGGDNWILLTSLGGNMASVFAVDANTGYIAGNNVAYKTTNGGSNWFLLPQEATSRATCIYFINQYTGFTTNDYFEIRKTTNGGLNWFVKNHSNDFHSLLNIHFFDSKTGFAVGDNGLIVKTTNGGENWINHLSPTSNTLYSVYAVDTNECYVSGDYNTILKTTNGGTPIAVYSNQNFLPEYIFLSQNYPNPFNPLTKIKFEIPLSRGVSAGRGVLVKLIIYDVLGREIETLVNDFRKPGAYEVDWDGSNYSSGIYFYRLITDEYTETKKMVLLK